MTWVTTGIFSEKYENGNLPAVIAEYVLGGRILYVEEIKDGRKGRFGVPRRNDLIFVHELGTTEANSGQSDISD